MTAKEMFEKLEYIRPYYEKDHTIEYISYQEDDFYGRTLKTSIIFNKRTKSIKIVGIITLEELQAINKQIEELGWLGEDKE